MFDLNSVLDLYTLVHDVQGVLRFGSVLNRRDFISILLQNDDLVTMDLTI